MNLKKNTDDVLLAMAEIEGEEWLDMQLRSIDKAKKWLGMDVDDVPDEIYYGLSETVGWALIYVNDEENADAMACIVYGAGGWNRWGVQGDGEVMFSEYHSNKNTIEKVKAARFEVF